VLSRGWRSSVHVSCRFHAEFSVGACPDLRSARNHHSAIPRTHHTTTLPTYYSVPRIVRPVSPWRWRLLVERANAKAWAYRVERRATSISKEVSPSERSSHAMSIAEQLTEQPRCGLHRNSRIVSPATTQLARPSFASGLSRIAADSSALLHPTFNW